MTQAPMEIQAAPATCDGQQNMLALERVAVRFDGKRVLDDFTLRVAQGEKVVLAGDSGAGKSTILACLLGFVQPAAGEISIGGEPLTKRSVWPLRTRIAYVPQEPQLGAGLTREAIIRPLEYAANRHIQFDPDRLERLCKTFLLDVGLLEKSVTKLSGGEKQRAAIVSALMLERPILLLDEITSALDERSRDAVLAYLRGRDDLTLLAISHDKEFLRWADRVVTLRKVTGGEAAS